MRKILTLPILVILIISLFPSLVLAGNDNILFYGKELGRIENTLKTNYTISKTQILTQNLSEYKVVTLITPERGISPEDVARLLDYVNSGGTLFIIAEDFTDGSTTSQINRLLSSLNISLNVDRLYDDKNFFTYNNNVLITGDDNYLPSKGVSRILYVNGCTIKGKFDGQLKSSSTSYSKNYDGLETYMKGQQAPVSAFVKYGKGIILLVGDRSLFEDNYVVQGDNALFALNLFDFAAGKYDLISKRVEYKEKYDEEISSFLSDYDSKKKGGFSELKTVETKEIDLFIEKAQSNYLFGLYSEAYTEISQAKTKFESEVGLINMEFNQKLQAAKNLETEAKNKGIATADEAVFNEGVYYLNQAEKEINLKRRIELLDSAILILENFGQGDRQRAKIEIDTAEDKLNESKKTLFYENDVQKAEEYLNHAKELFNQGDYFDASSKAIESQKYANRAIEKYNIFKIVIGLGLLLGVLILMIITKRIFSWKKQKKK
ncbi:MAG: hypothetical protein GYA51_14240 [Candidatus Methanofastidiosa archaeon]|jgi:hypothetical protein|nr:hypothetical protein [Candidatus Methanofastidiosa archaeon]